MSKGKIFFLLGVSGSGKSTAIKNLLKMPNINLKYVPSYTTREMREGEKQGNPYYFISNQEFEKLIESGKFLEYAYIHKMSYYGTKLDDVIELINSGVNVIKELDIIGLKRILQNKVLDGNFFSIFINVSDEILINRVTSRSIISEIELNKRLESASKERLEMNRICNYIIDGNCSEKEMVNKILNIIL